MPGGSMVGCPWLKALIVRAANFTLCHFANVLTHDASNGFRMFSRRTVDEIEIESTRGLCCSIELSVKCLQPYRRGTSTLVRARGWEEPIPGHKVAASICAGMLMCSPRHISDNQRVRCP
jgi:hypothetical protein